MITRTYQIVRTSVGFIDVTDEELIENGDNPEIDNDWENAAYELIDSRDFEVVDDEIDLVTSYAS